MICDIVNAEVPALTNFAAVCGAYLLDDTVLVSSVSAASCEAFDKDLETLPHQDQLPLRMSRAVAR